MELGGGRVSVHSDGLNKGSTFYFTMRLQQEEESKSTLSSVEEDSVAVSVDAISISLESMWHGSNESVLMGHTIRNYSRIVSIDNQE